MQSQADTVLTVVNVSSSNATACVRVFAAIAALAKSFKGYAAFARLLYDTSDELTQLARELRVVEVCTLTYSAAKILNQFCIKLPVIQRCSGCWRQERSVWCPLSLRAEIGEGERHICGGVCRCPRSFSTGVVRRWAATWEPHVPISLGRSSSSRTLWALLRHRRRLLQGRPGAARLPHPMLEASRRS